MRSPGTSQVAVRVLGGSQERDKKLKRRVRKAWFNSIHYTMSIKLFCAKPVRKWRAHTREMIALRHLFAKCFWPLHVWRKTTRGARLERQKASLLKQIYWCYFELHLFRAWKGWTQARTREHRRCDAHSPGNAESKRSPNDYGGGDPGRSPADRLADDPRAHSKRDPNHRGCARHSLP